MGKKRVGFKFVQVSHSLPHLIMIFSQDYNFQPTFCGDFVLCKPSMNENVIQDYVFL
jgi:hypothetical protein